MYAKQMHKSLMFKTAYRVSFSQLCPECRHKQIPFRMIEQYGFNCVIDRFAFVGKRQFVCITVDTMVVYIFSSIKNDHILNNQCFNYIVLKKLEIRFKAAMFRFHPLFETGALFVFCQNASFKIRVSFVFLNNLYYRHIIRYTNIFAISGII